MRQTEICFLYTLLIISLLSSGLGPIGCQSKAQTYEVGDTARSKRILDSISDLPDVSTDGLQVFCLDNRIFLVGTVQTRQQANELLNAADEVATGSTVEGYLPIDPSPRQITQPSELQARVKRRLAKQLGAQEARTIKVLVYSGQVVLVGFADFSQAQAAIKAITSLSGVNGVTNFMVPPLDPEDVSRSN